MVAATMVDKVGATEGITGMERMEGAATGVGTTGGMEEIIGAMDGDGATVKHAQQVSGISHPSGLIQ